MAAIQGGWAVLESRVEIEACVIYKPRSYEIERLSFYSGKYSKLTSFYSSTPHPPPNQDLDETLATFNAPQCIIAPVPKAHTGSKVPSL